MASSVAGPIERQLSTIAAITSMTSISSLGRSSIIIQFDLNRNIDGAALDVQTALTVAQRRLPIEMTTPPSFRKVNPGDSPILFISLMSATLPIQTVDDYGEVTLAQQISQLPGIAQVSVYGAQKFAIRVFVDPIAAAAHGLSLDDVRTVVAKANSNTSSGNINGIRQNTALHATAAMMKAADYRDVVAIYRMACRSSSAKSRGSKIPSNSPKSPAISTTKKPSSLRSNVRRTPIRCASSIP
jgi:HAE1 family hydrophobic/amphiphilic exporter-1